VAEREIRIDHVFDAPREVVFEAWTDPDQIGRWWCPEGVEVPRDSVVIELRVGGRFHLDMVETGTGTSHRLRGEFIELSPPELIVLKFQPVPVAGVTDTTITSVTFEVEGSGTRMVLTNGPYSEETYAQSVAGWDQIVASLDALLSA
jgi:uncharacterized protein YndB with AHSA1/START domain